MSWVVNGEDASGRLLLASGLLSYDAAIALAREMAPGLTHSGVRAFLEVWTVRPNGRETWVVAVYDGERWTWTFEIQYAIASAETREAAIKLVERFAAKVRDDGRL